MKRLLLLLTLGLSSFSGHSQTTKALTISTQQAAKIEDSLRVLPLVRREARQWQMASGAYQQAADSLRRALRLQQGMGQSYQQSLADQTRLTTSATAEATEWRSKARKRGVINLLLTGAIGALAYLAIAN